MRGLTRSHWLLGLGVLLAIPVVIGRTARADINTDEPGSIIVFPKVVANGERDTVIHLTNTSNMNLGVHCFYTNAYSTCENDPNTVCTSDLGCQDPNDPNDVCIPRWEAFDFDINLTPQQPTFWRVSTGRASDVFATPCTGSTTCSCTVGAGGGLSCPGFTSTLGAFTPAQGEQFIGELRCYEVDPLDPDSLQPMAFNKLKGEAFLETLDSGEISAYNAITVQANTSLEGGLNDDLDLFLNRVNMGNGEYNACAESISFTSHGLDDDAAILNTGGEVDTEMTLVPCSFIESEPVPVQVTILSYDQIEGRNSQSLDFPCYFSERMSNPNLSFLWDADSNPDAQFTKTEFVVNQGTLCWTGEFKGESCNTNADCEGAIELPNSNSGLILGCLPAPGVFGVHEEFYSQGERPEGSAAASMYNHGAKDTDDLMIVNDLGGGGD